MNLTQEEAAKERYGSGDTNKQITQRACFSAGAEWQASQTKPIDQKEIVGIIATNMGDHSPVDAVRAARKIVEYLGEQQARFTLEQAIEMCCMVFDGDYIHTLTNSNDVNKEIIKLVTHYATFPQFSLPTKPEQWMKEIYQRHGLI